MKLHRLVIAFIVGSGAAALIAGLWFKTPAFPTAKPEPAAAVQKPAAPAIENPVATVAAVRR